MARYQYNACTEGSWHDGGLGSSDSLAYALARAAQAVEGLGTDAYAAVTDTQADDCTRVRAVCVRARDCAKPLTPARALKILREAAQEAGWILPPHRPRRDPAAARVQLGVRVHPESRAEFVRQASAAGRPLGIYLDDVADKLRADRLAQGRG